MLDFRGLVKLLEERGELYRISRPVEPRFEMPAVMEQIEKQRKAFIFENVKGAKFPVINGKMIDAQAQPLQDHDVVELAGVKMEFFIKK